jgi:hypothetical protein
LVEKKHVQSAADGPARINPETNHVEFADHDDVDHALAGARGHRPLDHDDPVVSGHAESAARPGVPLRADVQPVHGRIAQKTRCVEGTVARDAASDEMPPLEPGWVRPALKAERVGFEPTVQFDPHTAFPVPTGFRPQVNSVTRFEQVTYVLSIAWRIPLAHLRPRTHVSERCGSKCAAYNRCRKFIAQT